MCTPEKIGVVEKHSPINLRRPITWVFMVPDTVTMEDCGWECEVLQDNNGTGSILCCCPRIWRVTFWIKSPPLKGIIHSLKTWLTAENKNASPFSKRWRPTSWLLSIVYIPDILWYCVNLWNQTLCFPVQTRYKKLNTLQLGEGGVFRNQEDK